jgi:hypothetical protein
MHYDDSLLAGLNPMAMGIEYQDGNGQWQGVGNGKVDTSAHTFTFSISHFSNWGLYTAYMVAPAKVAMLTGTAVTFELTRAGPAIEDSIQGPVQFPGAKANAAVWLVNGEPEGDQTNGTITTPFAYEGIYDAPSKMPDNNPMSIDAMINLPNSGRLYVQSYATVVAKDWTYEYDFSTGQQCQGGWTTHFTYSDTNIVTFHFGSDLQVAGVDIPGLVWSAVTDEGACADGYSIVVTKGRPTQINNITGGYNPSTNLLSLSISAVEADHCGYIQYVYGYELDSVEVESGDPYVDPVVGPLQRSASSSQSNKSQDLPEFVESTWRVTAQ